jgi:hypothetical protein
MENTNEIRLDGYQHSTKDIVDCQLMHIKDICSTLGFPLMWGNVLRIV